MLFEYFLIDILSLKHHHANKERKFGNANLSLLHVFGDAQILSFDAKLLILTF